jgi:membrane-bound ClpP family serine protease
VLLPFLIVGGVGLVLLLVSFVAGDVMDHLGIGSGALSGTALAIALVVFGAAGALTVTGGLALGWSYVLALTLAWLAYLLVVVVVRALNRSSDGVPASPVGLSGVATSPISAEGGEVRLEGPGEIERRLAFADEPIESGMRIRVIEHEGTRVKVIPA